MKTTERIIDFLVDRAGKEYSIGFRTIATVLGATFFIAGWPALVYLCAAIFQGQVFNIAVAKMLSTVFFIIGTPWMLWAVCWQLFFGKGTPVPIVPTKEFLSTGPYRFVRNPMIGGHFLYLLGWAALFNASGGYGFTLIYALFMIAEIKFIEERELERRFGEAYRKYKQETPFMLPQVRKP